MTLYGLPHSEISGSKPACGSPKLFAAYRVLHRLLAPRHPPYALINLTFPDLSARLCRRWLPRPFRSRTDVRSLMALSAASPETKNPASAFYELRYRIYPCSLNRGRHLRGLARFCIFSDISIARFFLFCLPLCDFQRSTLTCVRLAFAIYLKRKTSRKQCNWWR